MNNSCNNSSALSWEDTITAFLSGRLVTKIIMYENVIMVTVFPCLFTSYLVVLYLMLTNWSEFKNSYYVLILGLSISDLAMLLYTLYGYLYDLIGYPYLGSFINTVLSFVFYWVLGTYSTQIYCIFLSTNRFFAVVFFLLYRQKFSMKVSLWLIAINVTCSFAIVSPLLMYFKILYVPKFKVAFFEPTSRDRNNYCGTYAVAQIGFTLFDQTFSYLVAGCSMALYLFAVCYSIFKLKSYSNSNLRSSYVKEMKMMFQGFAIGLLLCTATFAHYVAPLYQLSVLSRFANMFFCGLNPVIYLALDRNLRQLLIKKLKSIKQLSFFSTSVTPLNQ